MWRKEDLVVKIKLDYYKEIINPNLEDQNYLSILMTSKRKVNTSNIRTNSHQIHSEIGHWKTPKMCWVERTCHLYESMSVEDENHLLLEFIAYTQIRSQFQNLCFNTDLSKPSSSLNIGIIF